jgi:hypothetical protein
LQSFEPVELALATRLFLSVCVAATVLGAAWTEKRSEAEGSQPEIHYAPRENLESVDAQEIGRAQLSIDIAAYVLSDARIIEALTDAAERDVLIRLYLDKSQFSEHGPTRGGLVEALLAHPNVVARVKGEGLSIGTREPGQRCDLHYRSGNRRCVREQFRTHLGAGAKS